MAWKLVSEKFHLEVDGERTLGRADFLDDPQLSRKHAKLKVVKGSMYVTDLGSTNGTRVRGQQIKAGSPVQVKSGEMIHLGGVALTLEDTHAPPPLDGSQVYMFTVGGTVVLLNGIMFLRPDMDFGRATGWGGFAILGGLLVVSAIFTGMIWSTLLSQWRWERPKLITYAVLVNVTTILMALGMFNILNEDWQIGDYLLQNKIEHYCLSRFDATRCINNVSVCPRCALAIDKWKREIMAAKLKTYLSSHPDPRPGRRLPASKPKAK